MPSSKVRWFHDGTEVLNNSLVNRGQQRFVIHERGGFEKTSSLILTNARAEDSGPFMCVSQNQAGRVEANFTLQVRSLKLFLWRVKFVRNCAKIICRKKYVASRLGLGRIIQVTDSTKINRPGYKVHVLTEFLTASWKNSC